MDKRPDQCNVLGCEEKAGPHVSFYHHEGAPLTTLQYCDKCWDHYVRPAMQALMDMK